LISPLTTMLSITLTCYPPQLQAAAKPYDSMSNDMVIIRVTAGYRLPRPADCPRNVHKLMMQCWNVDPTLRPTFAALVASSSLASQSGAGTKRALAHAVSMHRDSRLGSSSITSDVSGSFPDDSGDKSGGRIPSDKNVSLETRYSCISGRKSTLSPPAQASEGPLYLSLEGASGTIIEADRDLPSPDHTAHVNQAGIICISNGDAKKCMSSGTEQMGVRQGPLGEGQQAETAIFFLC